MQNGRTTHHPKATRLQEMGAASSANLESNPAIVLRQTIPAGQFLIDGTWRDARDGATMVTSDPTTEETITTVARASPADVEDAIDAAHLAFESGVWSQMPTEQRAQILFKIADLIQEREQDFALREAMDMGVPYHDFRAVVIPHCVGLFRFFGGLCMTAMNGSYRDSYEPNILPDVLTAVEAAPLLCAGVTTFNALRNSGATPGDTVAIHGIGGLGHLGIQFARQFGFTVVAIGRGQDKEPLARKLGAHRYLDTDSDDAAQALAAMGGAKVILATAPSGKAIAGLIDGLAFDGKLVIVAVSSEPIAVTSVQILSGRPITGWFSGTSIDSQDTLNLASTTGVRPMIETFPLERVNEAYEQMMSGRARFRAVLAMETGN
jgi:hypothetical protein